MKRSVWVSVALFSLLCSLWVPSALGQAVYGSILGTVTDPSGAAVNGAKVTVTSQTKDVSTVATTNESGNYSVTHLIPDVYAIRIEGTGFKTLEYKNVEVSADTAAKVDGQFQVGSASEQVEVTAEAPQLKTDRADVSIEFNAKGDRGCTYSEPQFHLLRTPLSGHAEARRMEPRRHRESAGRPTNFREWPALQRHRF